MIRKSYIGIIVALLLSSLPAQPVIYVFDCGGVLVDSKQLATLREIGPRVLLPRLWANNFSFTKVRVEYYDVLHQLKPRAQRSIQITDGQGYVMPELLCEWMLGLQSCADLLNEVTILLERQTDIPPSLQQLTYAISACLLEPERQVRTQELKHDVVAFMQEVYTSTHDDGSRKNRVYILSNYNAEAFKLFLETFPVIRDHCDGWYISGAVGNAKPAPDFYDTFMAEFNIDPAHEIIFIDDQKINRDTAQRLGWETFHPDEIVQQRSQKLLPQHFMRWGMLITLALVMGCVLFTLTM